MRETRELAGELERKKKNWGRKKKEEEAGERGRENRKSLF